MISMPKVHTIGGVKLAELAYLETTFGLPRRTAARWLRVLGITPIYIGNETYFALDAFQRIMYVLSRPGAPAFCFPGARYRTGYNGAKPLREVTPELLAQAADPLLAAEMSAGSDPMILRKLVEQKGRIAVAQAKADIQKDQDGEH